ncbi:hypothetical protein [Wenxinia marina]|uniref:hypothetical protein n=1 Tax=Wenxinia marina TaxID=390641 RepID=UPI00037DE01A|nr:hypothetical protein [Wenxinia marina]
MHDFHAAARILEATLRREPASIDGLASMVDATRRLLSLVEIEHGRIPACT